MVDRHSSYSSNHNPSFSSTLLDAIYRSIETETTADNYKDPMIRMKQKHAVRNEADLNVSRDRVFKSGEDMANYRRACMIEKWMEKKTIDHDKVRKPLSDLRAIKASRDQKPSLNSNSNSNSSSSSSSDCFFSSSEPESLPVPRPRPVRTGCSGFEKVVKNRERRASFGELGSDQAPKLESGGFLKTKSRALKIYGDLKKVREPISPGGRLAVFLNSLFSNGGNLKKTTKIVANSDDSPSLKSTNASTTTTTCSSASSFSRASCLSKTQSSSRKASDLNGVKRSVRFSSVSMIIDEDSKLYGHKILDQNDTNSYCKKTSAADKLSKDSVMSVINHQELIMSRVMEKKNHHFDQDSDDDGDDDAASYASSDLFELDNLSSIGLMESSYRDELPVYETTRPDSNRVIAYQMNMIL